MLDNICELCKREIDELTEHHLIPRTLHGNKKIKKLFTSIEMKENKILICTSCHSKIHSIFTEKELAEVYNTFESIKEHPEIRKFVNWIKKKPGSMIIHSKIKNT